ncbi:MAG: aspartate ammonia-lyase [bacterium]
MGKYRKEKDLLGEKALPSDSYYGINTLRAKENFPISPLKNHKELVRAICQIKIAAFKLFNDFNVFDKKICNAVIKAASEVFEGDFDNFIVVDVFQAGAGTSLHMNINEVIANRANELLGKPLGSYNPIHPNDTVNYGQSTNDVVPTAMRIATIRLSEGLTSAMTMLADAFLKKGTAFRGLIKSGRTHLTDATPITLGDEFKAYGMTIKKDSATIRNSLKNLYLIGLGGTATGSGLNAPEVYRKNIVKYLSRETGIRLKMNRSLFEAMENQGDFSHYMGALKTSSLNLIRICNDLRLLSSGPMTGLNEIVLPKVQAGSSIMPGKINPSIPEMVTMVCFYVCGTEQTLSLAVQAGQLELNVMMPIIAHSVLTSTEYLTNAINVFTKRCIKGITANREVLKEYALRSLGLATVLNPVLGYEKVAALVNRARRENKTVLELIREQNIIPEAELSKLIKNKGRSYLR